MCQVRGSYELYREFVAPELTHYFLHTSRSGIEIFGD